jgi:hypothetical protein
LIAFVQSYETQSQIKTSLFSWTWKSKTSFITAQKISLIPKDAYKRKQFNTPSLFGNACMANQTKGLYLSGDESVTVRLILIVVVAANGSFTINRSIVTSGSAFRFIVRASLLIGPRGPRCTRDFAVLASALYSLVAVFIQGGKVLPQFVILWGHWITFSHVGELGGQMPESPSMKFVLVWLDVGHFVSTSTGRERSTARTLDTDLEISKLTEVFPAIIQQTGERLRLVMGDLVSSHITTLGKFFMANVTRIGLFTRVPALMCLRDWGEVSVLAREEAPRCMEYSRVRILGKI